MLELVGRGLDDADRARDVLAALPVHHPAERRADLLGHVAGEPQRAPDAPGRTRGPGREREAEPVGALVHLRPDRPDPDPAARRARPSARPACRARRGCAPGSGRRSTGFPFTARIVVARAQARRTRPGGSGAPTRPSRWRRTSPTMNRTREQHDREQEVRPGPGEDREDALPRPRAPVRVRAERVVELLEPLRRAAARGRRERLLVDRGRERPERGARGGEVAGREVALQRLDALHERRLLAHAPARSTSRRRTPPAGASRGSSRSRRAGSPRSRTRSRSAWSSRSPAGSPT